MKPVLLSGLIIALMSVSAEARTIVVTNDDGLTSNLVALYRALKQDGHDVIVSVPCTNQSGAGTAMTFTAPATRLEKDCRSAAAKAGAITAGRMSRAGLPAEDFHYVDGTPTMAVLYGLDVVAQRRWGQDPELVLSGPNEGQNVGAIVLGSGTVSAAQFAALRGIPAIALSAGANTVDDARLAHPDSPRIARLSADLVKKLDALAGSAPLLPSGMALNVNFPDKLAGAQWTPSRIGTYNLYRIRFVEDVAASASAVSKAYASQNGIKLPSSPGLSIDLASEEPSADQQSDESIVIRKDIAISPMRVGYDATISTGSDSWIMKVLSDR